MRDKKLIDAVGDWFLRWANYVHDGKKIIINEGFLTEIKGKLESYDKVCSNGVVQGYVEFLEKWLSDFEFEMTGEQIAMLTKIKGIVTSYPIILKGLKEANKNIDNFIKSKQPPEVPEDLVESLYNIGAEHLLNDNPKEVAKEQIRKLLQQRQPEKVTVTRGEIKKMAKQVFMGGPLDLLEIKLENIFRSKGIPVTKK